METLSSKIIITGTRFTCTAPLFLTQYNKELNKKVHKICTADRKFKPQAQCRSCEYLEVKKDE